MGWFDDYYADTYLRPTVMDGVHIQWLRAAVSHPKEAPSASFRVRIKLNPKEADRRLTRIRTRFLALKDVITTRCGLLERDFRLQKTLFQADEELMIACVTLRSYQLGERHHIADVVLLLEDLMDEAVSLLRRARRYKHTPQSAAWSLQNVQARSLGDRIRLSFGVLAQMREDVHNEVYSGRFQQGHGTTWKAWIAGWVWLLGRKRGSSQSEGNEWREEHHEREHIFTPYKARNQECRCLLYR